MSSVTYCLVGAATAFAQELRVNEFQSFNLDPRADAGPSGYRCAWWSGSDLRGREVTLDGALAGGDFVYSTALKIHADVAVAPSGRFLVVGGLDDGQGTGIGARAFDAAGMPLGAEFPVNQDPAGFQTEPRVATLSSGRYAVVWQTDDGIWGRIVMEDGSMPYPEQVVPMNPTLGEDPAVAPSSGGGAAVVWRHGPARSETIRIRLFDDSMLPVGPEVVVNEAPGVVVWPEAAATPGGYVVAWSDSSGVELDVKARWLDTAGSPLGPEILVHDPSADRQLYSLVASDDMGRTTIAWQSYYQDGSEGGAYARRFDPTGVPLGPEFVVNGTTARAQGPSDVAMTPDGDFVVMWGSTQSSGNIADSFMRRYSFPASLAIAPGPGPSADPTVTLDQPDGLGASGAFQAYGTGGYGANVGAADLDGGIDEALTGPGPSPVFGPHVRAFRADGAPVAKVSYYAYGTLRFGVRPAGGRIDGDAFGEILTGPGAGEVFGPHVRGWDVDAGPLAPIAKVSFFAYQTLRWGVRVSAGDVDGDGFQEILTGPGPGQIFGAHVRGFDYDGTQVVPMGKVSFFAFGSGQYGATVGAADVESDGMGLYGDGYQEILAGRGPDPLVSADLAIFDVDGASATTKAQRNVSPFLYGATVAGGDVDAGDIEEVVTAPGPDPAAPATVTVWEWEPGIGSGYEGLSKLGPSEHTAFGGLTTHGASVAVGRFE